MKVTAVVLGTLWVVGAAVASYEPQAFLGPKRPRPNFIFILTDDQDLRLDSTSYMPLTRSHLQHKGTEFVNHFVTTALCCPSRVSLWTGKLAHNTNVSDVSPPHGR